VQFHHYLTHTATRISGPHHNYLAIVFAAQGETPAAKVVALPPIGNTQSRSLDECSVLREVLAGVADGNSECGTNYVAKFVQFVSDDTGPESIYREMAKAIVGDTSRIQNDTCQ